MEIISVIHFHVTLVESMSMHNKNSSNLFQSCVFFNVNKDPLINYHFNDDNYKDGKLFN